jgi:hypothetical protein
MRVRADRESNGQNVRITEVMPWCVPPQQERCKIAARQSVRRRYETNCCFSAADGFELCGVDIGPRSTHKSQGKRPPVTQGGPEAAEISQEGIEETGQSSEEIRKATTEGDQEGEQTVGGPPPQVTWRVSKRFITRRGDRPHIFPTQNALS